MKMYLFLILIFFTLSASAGNWLNHSKIKLGSSEAYSIKADCEAQSHELCYDMVYPSSNYSEVNQNADDYNQPIYSKSEVQDCISNANCDVIHEAKTCSDPQESSIKNYDLQQVYCSKLVGYEQKVIQVIALDQAKLSAWEEQETIKETARQKESAIQTALKRIECGKRVVGLLIVRNSVKSLNTSQVAQINTVYAPIKDLIDTGSLVTAKEAMLAITPDGTLITQGDKDDLVAEITKCL